MPRQTNAPASRERRLRRAALRKGVVLRKVQEGREKGRFYLLHIAEDGSEPFRRGQDVKTFTLEEIEQQLDA